MPHPLKLRIVRFSSKLVYVAVVYLLGYGVAVLLAFLKVADPVEIWLQVTIDTAGILYGARIFRGPHEDVQAQRPLWQMTATRAFSVGVGVVAAVGLALSVAQLAIALAHPAAVRTAAGFDPYLVQRDVSLVVQAVILVVLYFNSAAHLPRTESRALA
jgi:hypothetical protein